MNNTKNIFSVVSRNAKSLGITLAFLAIMSIPVFVNAETLTRQLELGMSGTDVSSLQSFLAKDSSIYPEGLVTGYFGALTQKAVSAFQSKNEIEVVGRVGPITLRAINAQMGNTTTNGGYPTSGDIYAPVISGVNVSRNSGSVAISWSTNEPTHELVYFDTVPLTQYEYPHTVVVSGKTAMADSNLKTSHNVTISGLQSNTIYYYIVYSTDASGNVTITMPSTFQTL